MAQTRILCASTSVTFEPTRHTASILLEPLLGCWGCRRMGAKSGGEKLRKLEWPARILCSTGNSPLHFAELLDRKSTRLNSSHQIISYAVFCLKKKNINLSTSSAHARDVSHDAS